MKSFKSDDMKIAFNAERSIQDAIQELSESDSLTVAMSYTVMFLYVAIALGRFKSFRTILVCMHISITSEENKNLIK